MRPAYVVEIVTPKKFKLNGLWFGPKNPKRVIVWIHGLTSSVFSMGSAIRALVDADTAVLTFNNRGFGTVNSVSKKVGKKSKSVLAGGAHEVFTDCRDDIQGAINFVRRQGVKEIYLAGHSTGCQKSIYWASKAGGGRGVKGIILFAPVSDYADILKRLPADKLKRTISLARSMVRSGKKHSLLPKPAAVFSWGAFFCDAQRFLSLYTPDSEETIFSYEQPDKNPRTLRSVQVPILTLWAEKDEYADRPVQRIEQWFAGVMTNKKSAFARVPRASHGFKGVEREVTRTINTWIKSL